MSSYEMMGLDDAAAAAAKAAAAAPSAPSQPVPSERTPTDFTIKAAALAMSRFTRVDATFYGYKAGYYNSSTFSKDKYTWAMACAHRLEVAKLIPHNSLEFSISTKTSGKDGWNNVAWFYNMASKVKYIPYDEYFATIQLCATPGSDSSFYDYMNLLCMWELTGISIVEKYNDKQLIENTGIPAAKLPVYKYLGYDAALLEKFMRDYYDAVLSFADKAKAFIMRESVAMAAVSKQFDLNTVAEYIRALRAGFMNDGFFDSMAGRMFKTTFYYTDEIIGSRAYPGFVEPNKGENPVEAMIFGNRTQSTEFLYDVRYYNVAGIPWSYDKKSIYQILKDIWNQQIAPAKIQLDKLYVQWNWLQSDPSKLSEQDILDLQNPDVNLFLHYNVGKTEELKKVVMDQLAKSNVIRNADKSVVPPNLQNRVQAVIDLPKTYAKFTPKYTYIPEGKVPSHYDDPKKFPFGLLIAGVAVAAGAYYSTK